MRWIRVKPGAITGVLIAAFAVSLLTAVTYTFLHVPAPPGYRTTAAATITGSQISRSISARNTALMKATVLGYDAQKVNLEARQAHLAAVTAARRAAAQKAAAQAAAKAAPPAVQPRSYPVSAGTYSYTALERIWEANGGSAQSAPVAACIAEHESGGRPNAISPTDDFGLWQIHGNPAALNPDASARIAVQMSGDGTNWSAWTTASMCGV